METLSIIIPVFNEANTIIKILNRIKETKSTKVNYEIIVVDDGSTDNTPILLEENKELAYISKELVTINTNLEITDDFNQFKISSSNNQELNDFFKELEFDSMIDDDFNKSDLRDTKYSIINNKKDFMKLKKSLSRIKEFSLDLETTSINALDAEIVGIAISYNSDEGFYIPLSHETDIDQLDLSLIHI